MKTSTFRNGVNTDPEIQPRVTLDDSLNTTDEKLYSYNISYSERYSDGRDISTVDLILNSGPNSVIQATDMFILTD